MTEGLNGNGIPSQIGSAALAVLLLVSESALAQQYTQDMTRPGAAITSTGAQAYDPSKNVLDLVEAAIKRQDDLRRSLEILVGSKFNAQEQLNELRYKQTQELATALANKLSDEAKLRAEYSERLAVAEAKRIDAIRAVDVNAVAVANQRTSEQATALQTQTTASAEVLRNQVSRSAEDLRALVATTAATALQNQQQQFQQLGARITTLEQAGSEFRGKQTFQDPAFTTLLAEVRALREAGASGAGKSEGISSSVAMMIALVTLLFGAVGVVIAVFLHRPVEVGKK